MAASKRARTQRRQADRDAEKLARDLDKLASLERGGSPEHPTVVTSASLVEPSAKGTACHRCGGELRVLDHAADLARQLRNVRTRCHACGTERTLYFRVVAASLH
jgi:hypothetical protein